MSANLTFDQHIRTISSEAKQVSGVILHSFKSWKTLVLLLLLKSLVHSKVRYLCPIWNLTDSTNINHLEDVQRQFLGKFLRFREYNEDLGMPICIVLYSQHLKQLKLYSLQRRQECYVIYMHKIKVGLVPNPGIEPEFNWNSYQFKPRTDRKNGRSSFSVTGPCLYNSLLAKLRQLGDNPNPGAKEVNDFKTELDKYLTTLPDNPGTQTNSLLHIRPGYITH